MATEIAVSDRTSGPKSSFEEFSVQMAGHVLLQLSRSVASPRHLDPHQLSHRHLISSNVVRCMMLYGAGYGCLFGALHGGL